MPIREEPFKNPFRKIKKQSGETVDIITHNGKKYEKVVRKK